MRCCRALQPEPSPLRTTRFVGRAAGVGGRAGTTSKYSDASNILPWTFLAKVHLPDRIERTTLRLTPRPKVKNRSRAPSLFSVRKLHCYFNNIRVCSFVLSGAPNCHHSEQTCEP